MTAIIKKIIFIFGLVIFVFTGSSKAQNIEEVREFTSQIQINKDASISVKETILYYFPEARHGIIRQIPCRYKDQAKGRYFTTDLKVLSIVDRDNNPWPFEISTSGNFKKIKIGDPEKTVQGKQVYIINYQVKNVINYFDDHDELYWNVTGTEWEVPIRNVQAIVNFSGFKPEKLQSKCYTGQEGSTAENCQKQGVSGQIDFRAQDLLTIVVGWEKGKVEVVARTYEKPPIFLIILSLLIFLGILGFLLYKYIKIGRDPKGRKTIAPEFEPPDKIKPAEMGTLIDEKADFKDLTATIIDLAVRGYLKIKQTSKKEFTLIKTKEADNSFKDFEKKIFQGIFQGLPQMELKDLKTKFYQKIGEIEKSLYQDLLDLEYFPSDPNKVRKIYLISGIVISSLGAALIFLLSISFWYLFLPASIIGGGVLVIIFSRFMPRKTAKGVLVKEKTLGFKDYLLRAERYRLQWQEKENIFEEYLPYAMVLGVAGIWAEKFKDIYKTPPDWYEGDYATFSTVVFYSSLSNFESASASSFSPPASAASGGSGFSGGFSGGGFGGGGGGSW